MRPTSRVSMGVCGASRRPWKIILRWRTRQSWLNARAAAGTHPIPLSYYQTHQRLGTWGSAGWQESVKDVLTDGETRLRYD